MNKFITSTSLLSICLLSSCSTFKEFRQDPATWGKNEKTKKVSKTTNHPRQSLINPLRPIEANPASNSNRVNKFSNKGAQKGRTIEGFIEPNVTKLPDDKDLQEANTVAPLPLTPRLETPVAPLLIDPSAPLPSNP